MSSVAVVSCDGQMIAAAQFRDEYYRAGVPVLLRGFLREQPLCRGWSPARLAARFGDAIIDVMHTGTRGGDSDAGPYRGTRSVRLGDFVEILDPASGADPGVYLVAQNQLLRRPEFEPLLDEMTFDPQWFDERRRKTHVSLWMGPAGTVTPLHFDLQNGLLIQAWGRKRVLLAAPAEGPYLYQGATGYSRVDPERPDLAAFPLFGRAAVLQVTLEPDDALFLPIGWWHHVRSLTASVSLSASNFAWGEPPQSPSALTR